MTKVGLVGAGFMGKMHASVYSVLEGAQVVAVADDRPGPLKELADQTAAAPYASLDSLLNGADVDAIDICLPTFLHSAMAVKALDAGKHTLCEKPMAVTLEQADAMIAASKRSGAKLMVAHCIRFWPEYQILRDIVNSGSLGALKSLSLTRVSATPGWAANNWLMDEELSGSAALDLHIHDTDYALFLLGQPDQVMARGTVQGRALSHIFATMRFGSVVVDLEGGWDFPATFPFKMAFRAVFEKGAVAMDGGPITVYEDGKDPVQPETKSMKASAGGNISDLGGYYNEIEYFTGCIANGKPLELATAESSRASLEVTLREIAEAKQNLA